MKTLRILIALIGIIPISYSCSKKSSDNTTSTQTTLFSSKFESSSDLSLWTQSTGGLAIIDSSAVKFTNITECFQFETMDLIPVQKGKSYELIINGKANPPQNGDPALCAGNFIIYIVQGSTNLLEASFGNYTSWTQRSFSFEAATSASVKIKFLIGTTRGAWIDDLKLIQN
jgi:hypothetical protein